MVLWLWGSCLVGVVPWGPRLIIRGDLCLSFHPPWPGSPLPPRDGLRPLPPAWPWLHRWLHHHHLQHQDPLVVPQKQAPVLHKRHLWEVVRDCQGWLVWKRSFHNHLSGQVWIGGWRAGSAQTWPWRVLGKLRQWRLRCHSAVLWAWMSTWVWFASIFLSSQIILTLFTLSTSPLCLHHLPPPTIWLNWTLSATPLPFQPVLEAEGTLLDSLYPLCPLCCQVFLKEQHGRLGEWLDS